LPFSRTGTTARSCLSTKKGVIVKLNSITDVMGDQLGDLRSAEMQLIDALPKMAEAATDSELKSAFNTHLKQTREHFARLQEIIGSVDFAVPVEECEAMKGLIAEGEKVIKAEGEPEVKDVALIAAAQRVEHYEISAYGTARTLAKELGLSQARSLLDATLDEESDADKLLTKIATGGLIGAGINEAAPR
jgi:ferritin-like metal-binding protein YciE